MQYSGFRGAARARLIAKLRQQKQRIAVLCPDLLSAQTLRADIEFFDPSAVAQVLAPWDPLPFEPVSPQVYITARRIRSLFHVASRTPGVLLVPAPALLQKALAPGTVLQSAFDLRVGQEFSDRDELVRQLDGLGFRRASLVEEVGDMAVRGSVIDLFPSTSAHPLRLEFFDTELERIKQFEPESQRSIGEIESVSILPVREHLPVSQLFQTREELQAGLLRVKNRARQLEMPAREIAKITNALKSGTDLPGIELAFAEASPESFLAVPEYLRAFADELLIWDEIAFWNAVDAFWDIVTEREQRLEQEGTFLPEPRHLYISSEELTHSLRSFPERSLLDSLTVLPGESGEAEQADVVRVVSHSNTELQTRMQTQVGSGQALRPLIDFLTSWGEQRYRVAFVVGSKERAERLQRLLLDHDYHAHLNEHRTGLEWSERSVRGPETTILLGRLSEGAQIPAEKLVFVAEQEIFGQQSKKKRTKPALHLKRILNSLSQLQENDYVVHVDYGVGIYRGLTHRTLEGRTNDLLMIEYADSTLYLPVQSISKVQRFVGPEGQNPALDRLSSNRWKKTKAKVRQSVAALAGDLIKLYAARTVTRGWRFEPIGAEDERFADSFPYTETVDQQAAIEATLTDMASDRPMDRLICGDVGFGKTEVALRAAFKCLQHSRQVAVLAPTTILVEQHLQTFRRRLTDYPVRVASVSRFSPPSENKKTLEQVVTGEIDVVVGTHRLLQKDVRFADLGLLIIDEEHRFGVKQKERLKQMRANIDVLTLTATPIPRTLHMSLLDIRDISLISTPPHDRRVIRTYTATAHPTLIRDSILRELQRQGQCFYVYNRVQGIELVTAQLQELVPEARFGYAHGQMSESQLERIMLQFMRRELDVLVCTTIVESGIDIPTANTIIIDRAHQLGLAQLYQLRGRVGRAAEQAYCYFLVPPDRRLSGEAAQRLKVLQSLDDLGQGFQLAVRDLEIRGAGNLLGKEQSGSVLAVGFELYTRILKDAIAHLKHDTDGEPVELLDPEVNIELTAYIPDAYIPDISERLVLYQRFASLDSVEEGQALAEEIDDRFGPPPPEVLDLIQLMSFRAELKRYGVLKADITKSRITLAFSARAPIDPDAVIDLVRNSPGEYRFSRSHTLSITPPDPFEDPRMAYQFIDSLLGRLTNGHPAGAGAAISEPAPQDPH